MSIEEAIETLEKMIRCAELDHNDCASRVCRQCEFHVDAEKRLESYKLILNVLENCNTPDMTKTVNEGVRKTMSRFLCYDEGTYQFKSYLTGVLDLANAILND